MAPSKYCSSMHVYIWEGQSGTRLPFLCCGHNCCMDSLHSCFISLASLFHSVLDSVLHPNRLGLCYSLIRHTLCGSCPNPNLTSRIIYCSLAWSRKINMIGNGSFMQSGCLIQIKHSKVDRLILWLMESKLSQCKCIVEQTMSYKNGKEVVRGGMCSPKTDQGHPQVWGVPVVTGMKYFM